MTSSPGDGGSLHIIIRRSRRLTGSCRWSTERRDKSTSLNLPFFKTLAGQILAGNLHEEFMPRRKTGDVSRRNHKSISQINAVTGPGLLRNSDDVDGIESERLISFLRMPWATWRCNGDKAEAK